MWIISDFTMLMHFTDALTHALLILEGIVTSSSMLKVALSSSLPYCDSPALLSIQASSNCREIQFPCSFSCFHYTLTLRTLCYKDWIMHIHLFFRVLVLCCDHSHFKHTILRCSNFPESLIFFQVLIDVVTNRIVGINLEIMPAACLVAIGRRGDLAGQLSGTRNALI